MLPSTSAPLTYTWTFPGAPVRVCIQLDVIRQLQELLHAGGGRAGILLGRVGRTRETEITGAIELADEGPAALAATLKSLSGPDGAEPIGFFRARAEGLRLTDEEYEIARTSFPDAESVFLVIQLSEAGPENATFFFWDAGQIHRDFAILEFPFDAALLAKQEGQRARARQAAPERALVTPIAASVPARPIAPAPPPQVPTQPAEHRHWRAIWLVLVCTVLGVLLAAGARYFRLDPWAPKATPTAAPGAPTGPSLGLQFHRQGTDLAVTWDRDAVTKYGATAGLLTVRDGAHEKAIGLNADLLRSANVLLSTESDQVQIQLTFLQANRTTVSESGIALLPARGSTDVTVRSVPTAPRPVAPEQVTRAPKLVPERSFTAPSGPAAPGPPRIDEPPVHPEVTNAATTAPITVPVSSPPVSAPARPVEPVPAPPAQVAAPPPSPASVVPEVTPAEFLSGDKPTFPMAAFNAHIQGIVVVEAIVGPDGKVKDTKVLSGHPLLRDAAMRAVRGWTFKPATIKGKAVEAPARAEVNFRGAW